MSVVTVSADKFGIKLSEMVKDDNKRVHDEVIRRAKGGGLKIQNATREVFRGPRSGRWYGRHRASAPGESPAILTGNLRLSFKGSDDVIKNLNETVVLSKATSNVSAQGDGINYAWIDQGIGNIAPRPYVKKVIEKASDVLIRDLRRPYRV